MDESKRRVIQFLEKEIKTYTALTRRGVLTAAFEGQPLRLGYKRR